MALVALSSLLVKETKTALYTKALAIATSIGLPVTSWQPGDPTRSNYHYLSEILAQLELTVAEYIAAGFLDHATGNWLTLLAHQVFGVTRTDATFATTTVVLSNGGGGVYTLAPTAGGTVVTFKNTSTGKTYRNTTGGTLASGPGTTLSVTVVADEAGSGSTAAALAIDALVTTLLGVTVSNADAATGIDAESDAALRQRCRDKLGSLSPNGPKDAYNYVARNSTLTSTTAINRSRSVGNTTTGVTTLYLAGPSGAVGEPDRALVETAILKWSTPLCITPTVVSATGVSIPVTYELWLYTSVGQTTAQVKTAVLNALAAMMLLQPIGGNVIAGSGAIHKSLIESTIRGVYPLHAFRVTVAAPAGDTALTIGQVGTLGADTGTITFISDP